MNAVPFMAGALCASLLVNHSLASELNYSTIWSVAHGAGANSVAHAGGRAYIASGTTLHSLNLASGEPSAADVTIDTTRFGRITSVAAHGNRVAVTVTSVAGQAEPGWVLIYAAESMILLQEILVGAGPDMLTFGPCGHRLLVANEGEPECRIEGDTATLVDPEGSITVIGIIDGYALPPRTVSFADFNGHEAALVAQGVRIFGPNATVAQDLEPEHIALGPLGLRAWVTLQENNAIALVDLLHWPPRVADIIPLGDKDHGTAANALDVNDTDGPVRAVHPGLLGMYQPDGIKTGLIDGQVYLFTANEGDARDYPPCFSEEVRVRNLQLDPAEFSESERAALANLRVTTTRGASGGVYRRLHAFGGRSFAVWDTQGRQVFDSGRMLEDLLAARPGYFFDARSDDKGPEPEDLAFGRIDGIPYLFVGLERANGVMAFDVSDPASPVFAEFLANPENPAFPAGEHPERLDFVPAGASPTGSALLLVTNEVSGTTRAFQLGHGP